MQCVDVIQANTLCAVICVFFFFNDTATTEIYTLSLHDALPISGGEIGWGELARAKPDGHTIGFTNTPNILTVPIERQARFRFEDRKSTRLNSSHANISYAVFCLKKKKNTSYLHMCHRIQCLAVI